MPEVDFDKLMQLAASPEVGKNAESLEGMLKEAERVLNFADKVISVIDRAGALPGVVRALGKKYGVDVETPLKTREDPNAIIPVSKYHSDVLRELNKVPEADLKKQFEEAAQFMKEHGKKPQSDTGTPANS